MTRMEKQVKRQQELMRSLRVFVDALRDVKAPVSDVAAVDGSVAQAVRAFCSDGSASASANASGGDSTPQDEQPWHELVWRRGLVPAFQQLCECMTQIDALEAEEKKAMGPLTPQQAARPKAPAGLLSLRDYSVLQAAVELLFCWAAHPRVAPGILLPVDKRRPTRTLEISKTVLLSGSRAYIHTAGGETRRTSELLAITQALLQLLSLPQFQPILLPKYVVELLALLVYGQVAATPQSPVQLEFARLQAMVLRVLPLRMSMSSLRAALGQSTPVDGSADVGQRFKARCGHLLSRLLLEDGGVVATIEMLLGSVDEGNTQARMQVATLICQCPSGEEPDKYASALCEQVRELLLAAVTPERGNSSSKLLGEMAALLADQLATRHAALFDRLLLAELFHPLLMYEDTRVASDENSLDETEAALTRSVGIAQLLLSGPPPSQHLLQALAPLVRPLLHMYGFATSSKSFLTTPLRNLLTSWVRSCSGAAVVLQVAVLPVTPPIRPSLVSCGYERVTTDDAWKPRRQFCAGGGGGIALRALAATSEAQDEALESLKALVMAMVELLGAKELENCDVVGELFSSLLLSYMRVRRRSEDADGVGEQEKQKSTETVSSSPLPLYEAVKSPQSAEGVELLLTLLLALIQCLGPSVLRSAATVLQCICTVLETYNATSTKLVDRDTQEEKQAESEDDGEEDDEILTICLGVVMTILEAGSSKRSDAEEAQLRTLLPILELLSRHARPEVAQLASDARVQILSRGAKSPASTSVHQGERSFEDVLREAETDLASPLVPLRARGVVLLTKLVRRSQAHARDADWTPRVHALASIFLLQLRDTESYVFLAAVQGLAALADVHASVAVPVLVTALRDEENALETRIKLSEALLFAAKRCGETLPQFAKLFVYAYLDCIRPPRAQQTQAKRAQEAAARRVQLIQEIPSVEEAAQAAKQAQAKSDESEGEGEGESEEEMLARATLRASCLSNLAEVCALLQWGLQPFLLDVLTCVFGVLQLELERPASRNTKTSEEDDETRRLREHRGEEREQRVVAVRRGAVFVLRYLVELLGWKMLELMPEQLSPLYRTLTHVARVDRDRVVRFHAQRGLTALGDVMRQELFPRAEEQDAALGISSLRIL